MTNNSLFKAIQSGTITKFAAESQLSKFKTEKFKLTQSLIASQIGRDIYNQQIAKVNFCIEVLKVVLDKWDDLKLPLKSNKTGGTENG